MSIIAKSKKSEGFEPIEAGSYPARVYQMIHLGTIAGYQGTLQDKVRVGFELPTEMKVFDEKKGEQPRVISQDFTLSFSEKANLRKLILACDPTALEADSDGFVEEFDVESLLCKSFLITINQKPNKEGNAFAFFDGATRLPKGMTCPDAINPVQVLSYSKWDEEAFNKMPDFIKDKMKTSEEYKLMKGLPLGDTKEDIPFE